MALRGKGKPGGKALLGVIRGGILPLLLLSLGVAPLAEAHSGAHHDAEPSVPPPSPGGVIDFQPPAAGTYELHRIMRAGDGVVLDIDGKRHRLSEYTRDKVTVLSFMYSSCNDPTGCPYAYVVLNLLKQRIEADRDLHDQIRLVTLSFDPARDTPERMALYGGMHAKANKGVAWNFLTTPSNKELLPILDAYGQDVFVEVDKSTKEPTGAFSHVLKLFLIDRDGNVREIYTSAYLSPDVLLNDIKTLLLESG